MENISNWLWQWITAYIPETKDVESANNPNSAISWQNFNAIKMSHSQVAKRNHGRNGIRKIPTQVVYGKISALYKNRVNTLLNNKINSSKKLETVDMMEHYKLVRFGGNWYGSGSWMLLSLRSLARTNSWYQQLK